MTDDGCPLTDGQGSNTGSRVTSPRWVELGWAIFDIYSRLFPGLMSRLLCPLHNLFEDKENICSPPIIWHFTRSSGFSRQFSQTVNSSSINSSVGRCPKCSSTASGDLSTFEIKRNLVFKLTSFSCILPFTIYGWNASPTPWKRLGKVRIEFLSLFFLAHSIFLHWTADIRIILILIASKETHCSWHPLLINSTAFTFLLPTTSLVYLLIFFCLYKPTPFAFPICFLSPFGV